MSNAKHTPGPWEAKCEDWERENGMCVYDAEGMLVARRLTEPNARLIAAAPELLFALDRILRELPQRRDWLDPVTEKIVNAAIAKARGE